MPSAPPLYEARIRTSTVLLPRGRTTSTDPMTRVVGLEEPVRPRGELASDLGLHRCPPRGASRRPTDRARLPSGRRYSSTWRATLGPTYASCPAMRCTTSDATIVRVFQVEEGARPRGRSTSDLPAARCIRVGAPRRTTDRERLRGQRTISSEHVHRAVRPGEALPPSGTRRRHDARASVPRRNARLPSRHAARPPTRAHRLPRQGCSP